LKGIVFYCTPEIQDLVKEDFVFLEIPE
jgi:hypothetical protein